MEALLFIALFFGLMFGLIVLYTAVVFALSGWLIPSIHFGPFGTAFRAAIVFNGWRLVLGLPVVILIFWSGFSGGEMSSTHLVYGAILMAAVDLFALNRMEAGGEVRLGGLLSRLALVAVLSVAGVGFELAPISISG